jgi:hypothetical protein
MAVIEASMPTTKKRHFVASNDDENILKQCFQEVNTQKKQKTVSSTSNGVLTEEVDPQITRLQHPYGIKPIGNFYEDSTKGIIECRSKGLGRLNAFSDVDMLNLLGYLNPKELAILSEVSRALYVFSSHDELWRTIVLETFHGNFQVQPTWKESYLATINSNSFKRMKPIKVEGFYSDLLFQSFWCANIPIDHKWIEIETIERRNASHFTLEQFQQEFERPNRPVIIENALTNWQAITKWQHSEYLTNITANATFSAGGFQMKMNKYFEYSRLLQDDQPLFIFDKQFINKCPVLEKDYEIPFFFQQDFFHLLPSSSRPDYRWLIIGPQRSGSSFHVDPNATNAWNAVIKGSKKWIMFPPEIIPPGVHPSEDGANVSTPVSLMEWFVTFYPQCKKRLSPHQQPLEGICRQGEIIFVPNGWWHLVLNLENSIAITQNFVSRGNLKNVLQFLKNKPEQVSGVPCEQKHTLYHTFYEIMITHEPNLLKEIMQEIEDEEAKANKKSKWQLLLEKKPEKEEEDKKKENKKKSSSSFTFGFSHF